MKSKLILICILSLALIIRFYNLDIIPSGINYDEASQGYNAYSILKTGKDEFGKEFPLFLRSFGFYASPLYAYLSIIPVSILGLTIFSVRVISALSGVLLVFFTFLIVKRINVKNSHQLALISGFIIAISPWSILFSRGAFEANLALTVFVSSIYFFIRSLKENFYLYLASIILAVSTYAYQSERLIAQLFLVSFLAIFWKNFNNKKIVIFSILLFAIIQLPQLLLLQSEGASIRFKQLSYLDYFLQKNYSSSFLLNGFLIGVNLVREFFSQYLTYFSPRNLFFDPDPQLIRSMPNLSVFYSWMIVPFFVGLKYLVNKKDLIIKLILILLIISPIPAAIVSDPFSSLRVLPLLWVLTIIISLGVYKIFTIIPKTSLKLLSGTALIILSLAQLYVSYFVLLNHERSKEWGYGYKELVQKLQFFKDKQVVIEDKAGPAYIEYAFLTNFDPKKMQSMADPNVVSDYYNQTKFSWDIKLDNIEFRIVNFGEIETKDQVIVVDPEVLPPEKAQEKNLNFLFDIRDKTGEVLFNAYQTNPKKGQ